MTNFPLTMAQQGLWFLSQIDGVTSAAYNMVFAFKTSMEVDPALLAASLQKMAQRHQILRCVIKVQGGVPQLQLLDEGTENVARIRLTTDAIEAVALAESAKALDLSEYPLYRVHLVQVTASQPQPGIVFTFPHLVFDDASGKIFFDELSQIYTGLVANHVPQFSSEPAALQVICQRETAFLGSAFGRSAVEETVQRLRGIPNRLALPRGSAASNGALVFPTAAHAFHVSAQTVAEVAATAQALRSTPVAIYLAAFQLLLWRYSGQHDFGLSIPVANRAAPGLQACLGYLTNLGIFRARIDLDESAHDFITSVAEQLLDLLDANELPFSAIAKQLRRAGDDIQGPLLQIGFNYLRGESQVRQFGLTEWESIDALPAYLKNEFKLDVQETAVGARCLFLYDAQGFEPMLVKRMAEHYQQLLIALMSAPQVKIADLVVLNEGEKAQLLTAWNATYADYPQQAYIHQLFEQQADKTPQAQALICGGQALTYAQLNARANQLAHHLRALGVTGNSLVAICTERSEQMVIGMLGSLKAGAAYVSLDPEYPQQRLAYILSNCQPDVILAQSSTGQLLQQFATTHRIVDLDAEQATLAQLSSQNLPVQYANASQCQLAYVIYTSGSTGKPKGVMLSHQNAVNFITWACGRFSNEQLHQTLLATSLNFDLAVFECFVPLCSGNTVNLVTNALALQQQKVAVSLINTVPSALDALLQSASVPDTTQTVNLAGEALKRSLVEKIFGQTKVAQVFNLYGPSETTTYSTCVEMSREQGFVPHIGRPISNTSIYILDSRMQPVPLGVIGEIHIGGAGVAMGYLNLPELTAEKFVANPFAGQSQKIYKTGDLGRYLEDGNIEFLGRIDHQVKVRGFRIELGEIENTLLTHPAVHEAVIVAREDGDAGQNLVAYLVTSQQQDVNQLRAWLRQSLPDYMVPSAWFFLDAMPLNANGKVERKALPEPEQRQLDAGVEYVAPGSANEILLSAIWCRVLKQERIGIHDNFFALGGHSLLATQVIAQVIEKFPVSVNVRELFDAPTIAAFASRLELKQTQAANHPDADMPITRQARMRSTQGV